MFEHLNYNNFDHFISRQWDEIAYFDSGISLIFEKDREHHDVTATKVKFLFLDKAYSAGLRRWFRRCAVSWKAGSKPTACSCDPVDVYLRHIDAANVESRFVQLMQQARITGKTLNKENLNAVKNIHQEFSALLEGRIRKGARLQSFTSKYLWFQSGIFPVYDTFARRGLNRLQNRSGKQYQAYSGYAEDFLALCETVYGRGDISPMQIKKVDAYLVALGANRTD